MDPDSALARITELASRIIDGGPERLEWSALLAASEELAESVVALDEWLRRGGFPPKAWSNSRGSR